MKHYVFAAIIGTLALLSEGTPAQTAASNAPPAESPKIAPRIELYAEFTRNTQCPVFNFNEPVELWMKVTGWLFNRRWHGFHNLLWAVSDWEGKVIDRGRISVPAGERDWEGRMQLKHYGAGYFQIHLKLDEAGISLPRQGTRPEGFVSYAALPDIARLPLKHTDDSRFGSHGAVLSNPGPGSSDVPFSIFPLVGMTWIYRSRRAYDTTPWAYSNGVPYEVEGAGPDTFKPVLDPEKAKILMPEEAKMGLCIFVDAMGIPTWLEKIPKDMDTSSGVDTQAWPPSDYGKYEDYIGKIAAEQAVLRKAAFPNQAKNYYEIHWEPDWHWKGSDEEFIKMYEHARIAIRRNDPDGLLLGANYGVLSVSVKNLERLFKKGLGKHMDGIITHAYNWEGQDELIADMRKLVAMAKEYLPANAPIIQTEWGECSLDNFSKMMMARQAALFIKGHVIILGEGARTTFFFCASDNEEFWFGLVFNLTYPYSDIQAPAWVAPKPVFAAAAAMTRLLDGTKNVCPIDYLGETVWGYVFDRGGTLLAVLWSPDDQARTVLFPCGAEKVVLYDPMGNRKEMATSNGVCRVHIGANPVYIEGFSRAAIPSDAGRLFTPKEREKEKGKQRETYSVLKVPSAPVIDGNPSEWSLESFQTVDSADALNKSLNASEWKGPGDLSFRYSFKYDDQALYAAFKVRDDSFFQQHVAAEQAWLEDSVQLGVALGRQADGTWKSFYKFLFAVNANTGAKLAYLHEGTPAFPAGSLEGRGVEFAFKRVGDESHYEIAIPWAVFDKELHGAPADGAIGLGILLNDADEEKSVFAQKRKAMEALGGHITGPKDLGTAILK